MRECAIRRYFENVGGMHFEAALSCLKVGGRVAVCGTISNYNEAKPQGCNIHVSNLIYQYVLASSTPAN
jgi:NADPH-dependent curcumin reductase CurA